MDETIKELIQFEPHWIHEKREYRELKRQHFGQRAAAAATGEQQPAAAAAQDNDDDDASTENEKEDDEQEKKQSAVVEKLEVRPSSAAPRIIMLKTNKEKEDEERKAAAAAKKNESEATSSSASHLQPFPFGGGGSRPLVQEIGPGGYRPAASSTLRPLIQEIVRLPAHTANNPPSFDLRPRVVRAVCCVPLRSHPHQRPRREMRTRRTRSSTWRGR
jgi:hypothetical protein